MLFSTRRLSVLLAVVLASVVLSSSAVGDTTVIHVDSRIDVGGDGSSWSTAYKCLHTALTDAYTNNIGDEVEFRVAWGTYALPTGADEEDSFDIYPMWSIRGGYAGSNTGDAGQDADEIVEAKETILTGDIPNVANNAHHVVDIHNTSVEGDVLLSRLTIVDGNANHSSNVAYQRGAGVCLQWGLDDNTLWLEDCVVKNNSAVGDGAGLYCKGAKLELLRCEFSGNEAGGNGGGIFAFETVPSVDLVFCNFSSNSADATNINDLGFGGAVYSESPTTRIGSCRFEKNDAGAAGGGVYFASEATNSEAFLVNSLFAENSATYSGNEGDGGAFYVKGDNLDAWNCTIVGSTAGGGVGLETPGNGIVLRNCIVWGNSLGGSTGQQAQIADASEAADVEYCCVQDGTRGMAPTPYSSSTNEDEDPLFVSGGYQLTSIESVTSPCVDTGTTTGMPQDILDLDGDEVTAEALPIDLQHSQRCYSLTGTCVIDMGAYEVSCWYVDDCAEHYDSGSASGRSWEGAFKYLSDALAVARDGETIRVAGGIYYPGHSSCVGSACTDINGSAIPFEAADAASHVGVSFEITEDVIIEGGYAGYYSGFPNERDPSRYYTIITGYAFDPYCVGSGPSSCCECVGDCTDTFSPPFPHPQEWGAGWNDLGGISFEPWACYGGDGLGEYHYWICDYYDSDEDGIVDDDEIQGDLTGIDNNSRHIFKTDNTVSSAMVFDGLIVLGGHAYGTADADKRGAGLYNDGGSPTVKNCTFVGNMSEEAGAAVFSTNGGSPRFEDCRFEWNTAEGKGGAVFNDYVEADAPDPAVDAGAIKIVACDFVENTANGGGGALVNESGGELLIANSEFAGNMAGNASSAAHGGAIHSEDASETKAAGCVFTGNKCLGSASGQGGAVYLASDDTEAGIYSFVNNTFSGNNAKSTGGLYGNLDTADTTTIANNIFWGNTDSELEDELSQLSVTGGGTTVIQYNTIENCSSDLGGFCATAGDNNDGDDPLYHNDLGWDQVLGTLDDKVAPDQGSPAIDSGSDSLLPTDWCDVDGDDDTTEAWPLDLEGNLRKIDGDSDGLSLTVDRGALEYSGYETCWFDYDGETPVAIPSSCDSPWNDANGQFRLNMSVAGGPAPRTYGPKHLDPMMSSSPMVSKESSYISGPNQHQQRPTHNDVIDLITGHPLIQETDFELPFGGASFRHIRTYASRNQTAVTSPGDYDPNADTIGEMWDWNGLYWMMSENPILLIDAQYNRLIGPTKTVCYLILDAHHTIPFEEADDDLYLAPPWFDAVLQHNGEGGTAPTEFYAYLHGRSIKYTFEVHDEDLWTNMCGDDSGTPGIGASICPCPDGVSVHGWPDGSDPCADISSFYYGLPKYGLLTKIEDRYGNTTKMEYSGQERSEGGSWDDYPQYDHDNTSDTSPNQLESVVLTGRCLQDCPSKGQLRSVKLYPGDGTGGCSTTAEWTIAYCHRSFFGPGQDTVQDLHYQRALHSVHVYEGDVYLDDLDDSEFTIYPDFRNEATLEDYEELDADFLPDDWVIEVKYLYSELMANCPITSEYEAAVDVGEGLDIATKGPMQLIKTKITRRPEDAQGASSEDSTTNRFYWYGQSEDLGDSIVAPKYLKAIFSDENVTAMRADSSDESIEPNDILKDAQFAGLEAPEMIDALDYAELVFDDGIQGTLCRSMTQPLGSSLTFEQIVAAAIGLSSDDGLLPVFHGYETMVDRRGGAENGTYKYAHFLVAPGAPGGSEDMEGWVTREFGTREGARTPFPELYLYPHRFGINIAFEAGEQPDSHMINERAFVAVIDKVSTFQDGSERSIEQRKIVEMNAAGHVLRSRTWEGSDISLTPDEQSGYGEEVVLDDYGRMLERRSAGWGSPENTNTATDGLIHLFDYEVGDGCVEVITPEGHSKQVCERMGNLLTVSIQKGTSGTVYPLSRFEYGFMEDGHARKDLMTESVVYPWAGATDGEATEYQYVLADSTGADIHTRPVIQKTTIGPSEQETEGGTLLYPAHIETYDDLGNKVATGAGHLNLVRNTTDGPLELASPSSTDSRFFMNIWEYDDRGQLTRLVTDADNETLFLGSFASLARMVPEAVCDADASACVALDLETTMEYEQPHGLSKITLPDGREHHLVYVEDPTYEGILYQWTIKNVDPDGSGQADVYSAVEMVTFIYGQQRFRTTLQVSDKISYPPDDSNLPSIPLVGTPDLPNGWSILQSTELEFDTSGRLVSATVVGDDGESISQQREYDAFGFPMRDLSPDGTITRDVYDERGRLTHTYRGTNDINEYWSTGIACDAQGQPAGCYDPEELPDNLMLLEKRFYGEGVNNAGLTTQVRKYRSKPTDQYHSQTPDGNNEDSIGSTTDYYHDWRMRETTIIRTAEDSTVLGVTYTWFDHMDRPVLTAEFTEVPQNVVAPDTLGPDDAPGSIADVESLVLTILAEGPTVLKSLVYQEFNAVGRVCETRTYDVHSTTPRYSSTRTFYDHQNRAVEVHSGNGSVQRTEYDAKGRPFLSWSEVRSGTGLGETRRQLSKTFTEFDESDRAIRTVGMERPDGLTTDALDRTNAICSINYNWYDKAGRLIGTIDFGSNVPGDSYGATGLPDPLGLDGMSTPEDTYPALLVRNKDVDGNLTSCSCDDSDAADARLTCFDYDDAGRQILVIEPGGVAAATEYDSLGRVVLTTENALDTNLANQRFTASLYDDNTGQLLKMAAVDSSNFTGGDASFDNINWDATDGSIQVTEYVYGAEVFQPDGTGSYETASEHNGWIGEIRYPDPDTGQPSTASPLRFTYRSDGLVATRTDEREVQQQYLYDDEDRISRISVIQSPKAIVDSWATHLEYAYTASGLLSQAKVLDDTESVLSKLDFQYGAWDNLTGVTQTLSDGTTLLSARDVTYAWEQTVASNGSYGSRLESIEYPTPGKDKIDFAYGASGSLDDHLNRVTALSRGVNKLAGYRYMGHGRVVGKSFGASDVLTMNYDDTSCGGAPCVADWDRFGRVKDISWKKTGGIEVLGYGYTYNTRGNRTAREARCQGDGRSWAYSYDNLNRLISATKGDFTAGGGFDTTPTATTPQTYTWALDSLGNWSGASSASHHRFADADGDGEFDSPTDVTLATEHHDTDLANEIESRTRGTGQSETEIAFGYDDGGNLIYDGKKYYRYDYWNRLIAICDSGSVHIDALGEVAGTPGKEIERFEYDALNRRVRTLRESGTITHHYYGSGAEVLAEFDYDDSVKSETLERWFVHGESFPDPLVMVDLTSAGDIPAGTEEVLFYLKDALGSVGALADTTGKVVERYVYDPYGRTTILREDGKGILPPIDREYFFDFDLDGDIDLDDETYLTNCMTDSVDPFCVFVCDIDGDKEVTLSDQSVFTTWISDPGNDYGDAPPSAWQRSARAVFDIDGNGEIDLYDFDGLERCIGKTDALCLGAFDLNGDGAINLYVEFAAFAEAFEETDKSIQLYANGSRFGNPFMWTGQRYDPATRLYHFMYRSYDPNLGRWLQEDMQGPMASLPEIWLGYWGATPRVWSPRADAGDEYGDGLYLYIYTLLSPLSNTDPYGLAIAYADQMTSSFVRTLLYSALLATVATVGSIMTQEFTAGVIGSASANLDLFLEGTEAMMDGAYNLAEELYAAAVVGVGAGINKVVPSRDFPGKTIGVICALYIAGTMSNAPMPKGGPPWEDIIKKTWEELCKLAKKGGPPWAKTVKKELLKRDNHKNFGKKVSKQRKHHR